MSTLFEEVLTTCRGPQVCAKCSLRMRMLNKDLRCPLCKAVNEEVVMVRPSHEGEDINRQCMNGELEWSGPHLK